MGFHPAQKSAFKTAPGGSYLGQRSQAPLQLFFTQFCWPGRLTRDRREGCPGQVGYVGADW